MPTFDVVPWDDWESMKDDNEKLRAEVTRIKTLIEGAPHGFGCEVSGHRKSDLDGCTCWKIRALANNKIDLRGKSVSAISTEVKWEDKDE